MRLVFAGSVIALVTVIAVAPAHAQSSQNPDDVLKQSLQLMMADKPAEAAALLEKLIAAQPAFAGAYDLLADAHSALAEKLDAGAPARRQHLETAAKHYQRAIELTHVNRAMNLHSLAEVYGPDGLNQPREAERVARRLAEEHPTLISGHVLLVRALLHSGRAAEASAALARARNAVPADDRGQLAGQLVQLVQGAAAMPRDSVRLLLDEALRLADEALTAAPKDGQIVMLKGAILDLQAKRVEQDAARRAALEAEGRRLWEAGRVLNGAAPRSQSTEPPPAPPTPAADPAQDRHRRGVELWHRVNEDKKMPPAEGRKLLDEANALFDEALKMKPENAESLVYKSLVLRLRAERFEPDAARAKALVAEADRLRARAMELMQRRE